MSGRADPRTVGRDFYSWGWTNFVSFSVFYSPVTFYVLMKDVSNAKPLAWVAYSLCVNASRVGIAKSTSGSHPAPQETVVAS